MMTLVISDLHIGSPLFTKKTEVLELIKSIEYKTIIFNGDIFDIWEDSIDDIASNNFNFINEINEESKLKTMIFIMGNHDPDISIIKRIFPYMNVVKQLQYNKDIFIIHGDEFDSLVTKYSLLAKFLFIPHWLSQRLFHFNLKAFFRKLFYSTSNKKRKPYFSKLIGDIENEAIEEYKNMCKYLIMGHTHVPKIVKGTECTYINCGDLIDSYTCLTFDDKNNFKLINI